MHFWQLLLALTTNNARTELAGMQIMPKFVAPYWYPVLKPSGKERLRGGPSSNTMESVCRCMWTSRRGRCSCFHESWSKDYWLLGWSVLIFWNPTLLVPVVLPLLGGYWCNTNQIQSGYLTITWEPGTCWNQEINEINWIFRFFQVLEWS